MASDYEYRTLVTRLTVGSDQRALLEATVDEWRRGCQLATDLAWEECYQPGDVQSLAYDPIRDRTGLGSQHTILATRAASDAIKTCITRFRHGKTASKPTFTAPTIRYDARSMTLFDDETVSLATVEDRIRCPLELPSDGDGDRDGDGYQYQYLDADDWELTESTLTIRDGDVYLHVGGRRLEQATAVDHDHPTAEDGAVLGVDMGVHRIAVTSTARFFHGGALKHRLDEYERIRGQLDRQGTRTPGGRPGPRAVGSAATSRTSCTASRTGSSRRRSRTTVR